MGTTQDKVLAEVEKIATDAGLDYVDNPLYANTGMVLIQNGWDTVLGLRYHFENGHCDVDLGGPAVSGVVDGKFVLDAETYGARRNGPGILYPKIMYTDGDRFRLLFALLRAALATDSAVKP